MLFNLKFAVVRSGRQQWLIAQEAGISETRLSRLIRGRLVPTEEEERRLAEVLGVPASTLFQSCGEPDLTG